MELLRNSSELKSNNDLLSMLSKGKSKQNSFIGERKDFKSIYQDKTEKTKPVERKQSNKKSNIKKSSNDIKEKKTDLKDITEKLEETEKTESNEDILEILMSLLKIVDVDMESSEEVEKLISEINLIIESMDIDVEDLETLKSALGEMIELVKSDGKEKQMTDEIKKFLGALEEVDDSDEKTQKLLEQVKEVLVQNPEKSSEIKVANTGTEEKLIDISSTEVKNVEEFQEEETDEVDTKDVQKISTEDSQGEIREEPEEGEESLDSKDGLFKDNININVKAPDNPILDSNRIEDILELTEVEENEVIKQIVEGVKINVEGDKSQIRMHLKPEALGQMIMNFEVSKGELVAKILVQNEKTKEVIQGNLLTLQEELEETGMEIKTFEVFVGSESDFEEQNEHFNFFNQNQGQNKKFNRKNDKDSAEQISMDYEAGTVIESVNPYLSEGGFDLKA